MARKFHDISNNVVYDFQTFKYKLIGKDNLPYHLEEILNSKVNEKDLTINLPTVDEIVMASYPFIDKLNPDVVNKIIHRNQKINRLVYYAIEHRKSEKLVFDPLDEKDRFVIQMAKQYLYDLNKYIYKYEINSLYCNLTFLNNDINQLFIGTIDILGKGKNGWHIILLKASKTNYLKKYMAELYLQKLLFESNSNLKVQSLAIFNPRSERYVIDYVDLTNKEKYKLVEDFTTFNEE